MANKQRDALKDPRVTNESCWKSIDDNRIPNPPLDIKQEKDPVYAKATKERVNNTKVIMAHEFRENPEGFKAMANAIADSYNEEHRVVVGGQLPEELDKNTKWKFDPLKGYSEEESDG